MFYVFFMCFRTFWVFFIFFLNLLKGWEKLRFGRTPPVGNFFQVSPFFFLKASLIVTLLVLISYCVCEKQYEKCVRPALIFNYLTRLMILLCASLCDNYVSALVFYLFNMIYVKYYSYLSIINKWVFYFKMFDNHGVFQKIYLQENLILSYYPRPADSIGHYVGLSVCRSKIFLLFKFLSFGTW